MDRPEGSTGLETRAEADAVQQTAAALTRSEEYRVNEANRRHAILETYNALVHEQGKSKKQAAKEVGESVTTIWRWRKAFAEDGFNGLLPETDKCGRPSTLKKLGIDQETINQIRGLNLDTNSTTTALRLFAQTDKCPEQLAAVILDPNRCSKHALPPSLRRAVMVSRNEKLAHQGQRALNLGGIWIPRKLDILPGDIFCSDDTTPIWAWWTPWHECEEYPFGVKLLQGQLLPVIDVASQAAIAYALICREAGSYRACDIWALFGHVFDTVGLPRLGFQLERGSWEANLIAGMPVEYQEGEATMSRRVGGLRQLPTNITAWHREKLGVEHCFPKTLQTWTSYLPKTKSIEAFFNRSQTLEGTLWGCLGRDQMRKPFEKAKRLYEQCRRERSKVDPRDHFLSQTEMMTRLNGLFEYLNNEPMEGEVFAGIPQKIFEQARAEYPLLQLPEESAWLYKRDWRKVTITQGWARVRLTDELTNLRYSLFYTNPTVFARHDVEGQEVFVYYDKQNFEQPAQIILARTGEWLCEAKYEDRRGTFLGGDKSGHDVHKLWKGAVMQGYGTIVKHAPSRQVPEEIKARREHAKALKREERQASSVVAPRVPASPEPEAAPIIPDAGNAMQRQRERLARQAAQARKLMLISE